MNRKFVLTRIFFVLGVFFVLVAVLGWLASTLWHSSWNADQRHGGPPTFGPLIGLAIIIVSAVFVIRRIRRTVGPLVAVMDAANRVAEGDFGVRVSPNGPSEVSRLIASFNAMAERLDVNETQRRRLFADIAHELRTPLSIIQGNIEGMLDGVYPRDDTHLAPLLDETRVIARLLNDLQTIATAEAGMLRLHRDAVAIRDLLQDVVAAFRPSGMAAGITMVMESDDVELEVDPVRIRQVLDNLVVNALRYTAQGGTIRLAAREEGKTVAVSVSDDGCGMSAEDATHMFERFVKSKDSGGSGLGLAIARSIVEAHGGTIAATSAPGEGTTVRFKLPCVAP